MKYSIHSRQDNNEKLLLPVNEEFAPNKTLIDDSSLIENEKCNDINTLWQYCYHTNTFIDLF